MSLLSFLALLCRLVVGGILLELALIFVDAFHLRALWQLRHIPGPPPVWLLGNLLDVAKHGYFPHRVWAVWGERYGGVFKWFWGPQAIVCVRDAEVARQVMVRHSKVFPDRSMFYPPQDATVTRVLAAGITFAKGAYWHGLRGSLQPMFHSATLASYQPLVARAAQELCGELQGVAAAGRSVDMHAALSTVALKAVGEAAFGVPFGKQQLDAATGRVREDAIVRAANFALENTGLTLKYMITPHALRPLVWAAVRAAPPAAIDALNVARMQLFSAAVCLARNAMARLGRPWADELRMADKFARPETRDTVARYGGVVPAHGSIVDLLVRAKDRRTGQPLSEHQIVAQVNSLVVAGHDTTSFCLTSTLFWVATHARVKAKLLAEIEAFGWERHVTPDNQEQLPYLDAVLRESLRLSPPGWMTTRQAEEDVTLPCGLHLPRGTIVYIDIIGIQRDPAHWGGAGLGAAAADVFQPERFLDQSPAAQERNARAWLAFGAGPRTCIGYKFALNEAKAVLVALWQRYDFVVDESRTPLPPALRPGITLGYRGGLHFHVTQRDESMQRQQAQAQAQARAQAQAQ